MDARPLTLVPWESDMNRMAEQFQQANQTGVETLASAAQTAFAAMERLAALNLNTARHIMERNELNSRSIAAANEPGALLSLQTSAMLEDSRLALDYSRRAIEISSQASQDLARLFTPRA